MEDKLFGAGVVVIIFNKDLSKILLLKRNKAKRDLNKADWGNFGGKLEWGEKLKDAAVREVLEESSIKLDPLQLHLVEVKEITENPVKANVHFLQFVYVTTIEENSEIKINDESDEYAWFDLNNLPERTLDKKEDLIRYSNLAKKIFLK